MKYYGIFSLTIARNHIYSITNTIIECPRNSYSFTFSQESDVLAEERRQRVLDLVSRQGCVALAELAEAISVSESTIRRDLDYWHQQGVVKRTHGGAIYLGESVGLPALEERTSRQIEEKKLIAQAAAARVRDGDALLLDGGT